MNRNSEITRETKETKIELKLCLEGGGVAIDTGSGFLDHMLTLFASHGRFGLTLNCVGDTGVDYHHTVEDVGIVLGEAFKTALGDKRGIIRYGDILLPMDDALILCAVDISGRAYLNFELEIPASRVGDFDTELVKEFYLSFVRTAGVTLHFYQLAGENSHHIIEASFKAFGRVMRRACTIDPSLEGELPSTKGVL